MAKAPAFQFYVKDWLSDPQLKMASHSTKGIWADMLCFMWEAPERGVLVGNMMQLQKLVSATDEDINRFFSEARILMFCDISVTDNGKITENNALVTVRNRRMWRDEKDRKDNRLRQERYRGRHNSNGKSNEKITPPSSTASPSSKKEKKKKEVISDEEWLKTLEENAIYAGLEVGVLYGKMLVWCENNGKKPTRRRFVNWLNREERPLKAKGEAASREQRKPTIRCPKCEQMVYYLCRVRETDVCAKCAELME